MFDDIQPPKPGSTPTNLPVGEPEDMFEHTNTDVSQTQSVPTTPTPTHTALDAGVLKPKIQNPEHPITPPAEVVPTSTPSEVSSDYTLKTPSAPFLAEERGIGSVPPSDSVAHQEAPFSGGKILAFVVTLAILILLGFGSLWIYTAFIKKNSSKNIFIPATTTTITTTTVTESPSTGSVTSIPTSSVENTTENSILFGEPVDTDGDGISDVDEAKYKTDALKWDTDEDGLSDGDEVMIWKTNPLVADTDGDGYGDNVEIKNGYNPNGSGKLFEPPTSTTSPLSTTTSP